MSVLKGEGRFPILFGSTSIAAGPLTHRGYLARPDLGGEWPTILLLPSAWGVTSSTKDIARRLARQGFAVVAIDLYGMSPPPRDAAVEVAEARAFQVDPSRAAAVIEDIVAFTTNPTGFWSSAGRGYGVLAVGRGVRFAIPAAHAARVRGLAMVAPALTPVEVLGEDGEVIRVVDDVPALAGVAAPILGLSGDAERAVVDGHVERARAVAPHAEWVVYEGADADFADDYRDGFDVAVFGDTMERLTGFFTKVLAGGGLTPDAG